MMRQQKESTWPFLCLLACLFVLSAMSPRPWQRLARSKSIGEVLEEAKQEALTEQARAAEAVNLDKGELALATPVRRSPPLEPTEFEVAEPQLAAPAPTVESRPFSIPDEPLVEARMPEPEPPVFNAPPRDIAPHSEVLAPVEEHFPLLASMPSLVSPMPAERVAPSISAPVPNRYPVTHSPSGITRAAEPPANDRLRQSIIAETDDTVAETGPAASWEPPTSLLADLDGLATEQETGDWVQRVRRQLESVVSGEPERASEAINRLEELAGQVDGQADELGERPLATRWRRTRYALRRRIDIWKQALAADKSGPPDVDSFRPDPQHLAQTFGQVEAATGESAEGRAWREFLLLDSLRPLVKRPEPADAQQRRLAKRILDRLGGKELDPGQRRFVANGPLASLGKELHRWTVKPVDRSALLRNVERFEQSGLPSDARRLAEDRRTLALSRDADRLELARLVDGHYRNANLRVAVSEKLINRLMPVREPQTAWVNDTVLGNPTRGHSQTSTDVGIRLIPDPNRLRLALEVNGHVASLTSSASGPATFFNNSQSTYTAVKPIEFSTRGVRTSPAKVSVQNVTKLRDLETDFDGLPLFGSIVKSVARKQHHSHKQEVQEEVKRKVASRAKAQVDTEADARFGEISQRLQQRVIRPIAALSLGPDMISAQTTESRLVTRIRLADEDQLGAHTPRPRAPSDSLASMQLHQSALNNTLEQLELAGRSFTLPELRRLIATRFNRPEAEDIESPNDDITIAFAKVDPIIVRCHEGRVEIRLSIAKLRKPSRKSWRDFQVRVFYRPKVEGLSLKLVRDGVVQLSGKRLDTGSQIAMRGVFSKTFSKHRPVILTPTKFTEDTRLKGLAISQFVIDDGWIGLALGPERAAPAADVVRR